MIYGLIFDEIRLLFLNYIDYTKTIQPAYIVTLLIFILPNMNELIFLNSPISSEFDEKSYIHVSL